ncbi:hypothetical protein PghCCS26_29170 [Paenibacillus glycanilyticus]|uniref:Uncharacterized protein n=1 Tax=Paenibacillus glycanilyticus TaxID=126569 RepID=A0ABQ6NM02_9BACL|nr:hypothetical protein PghCCS26_29170 [Paenibacillus glycanilyticus]
MGLAILPQCGEIYCTMFNIFRTTLSEWLIMLYFVQRATCMYMYMELEG